MIEHYPRTPWSAMVAYYLRDQGKDAHSNDVALALNSSYGDFQRDCVKLAYDHGFSGVSQKGMLTNDDPIYNEDDDRLYMWLHPLDDSGQLVGGTDDTREIEDTEIYGAVCRFKRFAAQLILCSAKETADSVPG
jgi:hypothetical protein